MKTLLILMIFNFMPRILKYSKFQILCLNYYATITEKLCICNKRMLLRVKCKKKSQMKKMKNISILLS